MFGNFWLVTGVCFFMLSLILRFLCIVYTCYSILSFFKYIIICQFSVNISGIEFPRVAFLVIILCRKHLLQKKISTLWNIFFPQQSNTVFVLHHTQCPPKWTILLQVNSVKSQSYPDELHAYSLVCRRLVCWTLFILRSLLGFLWNWVYEGLEICTRAFLSTGHLARLTVWLWCTFKSFQRCILCCHGSSEQMIRVYHVTFVIDGYMTGEICHGGPFGLVVVCVLVVNCWAT